MSLIVNGTTLGSISCNNITLNKVMFNSSQIYSGRITLPPIKSSWSVYCAVISDNTIYISTYDSSINTGDNRDNYQIYKLNTYNNSWEQYGNRLVFQSPNIGTSNFNNTAFQSWSKGFAYAFDDQLVMSGDSLFLMDKNNLEWKFTTCSYTGVNFNPNYRIEIKYGVYNNTLYTSVLEYNATSSQCAVRAHFLKMKRLSDYNFDVDEILYTSNYEYLYSSGYNAYNASFNVHGQPLAFLNFIKNSDDMYMYANGTYSWSGNRPGSQTYSKIFSLKSKTIVSDLYFYRKAISYKGYDYAYNSNDSNYSKGYIKQTNQPISSFQDWNFPVSGLLHGIVFYDQLIFFSAFNTKQICQYDGNSWIIIDPIT